MKRVLTLVGILALVLVGLIAWRIRDQAAAEAGPASGSGVIEAEGVDLGSRISARVARVHVAEGSAVQQGALLLELECDEPRARLAEAEARLEVARAQTAAADAQALAARGQSAAAYASIGAVGAQLGVLESQQELASRDADRIESMGDYAALSARDRARSTALTLTEQQRATRATQLVSRRQAAASTAQAQAAQAQAAAAAQTVRALEALVASARLLVDECTVKAPRTGVLERIYYEQGELVMLGAQVARLVEPERVSVTFYLANADVGRARVGMAAEVRADAYPEQRFVGKVTRIGLEAEFTPRNVQTRSDRDRLVFPVEVLVDKHDGRLRTGMQVVVSLNEVRQ